MTDMWAGILAGFCLGWGAATVLCLIVVHYNIARGYYRVTK